jgi:putative tryptophan/tyrosine transport system substrate-binding protein
LPSSGRRGRSRSSLRPRAIRSQASLGGKWLELLSEIAPGLKRAAIMFNPDTAPASIVMPSFHAAARSLKVAPIIAPVRSNGEIETTVIALGREPGGGLVFLPDGFMTGHRAPTILAAARNNVPAVYPTSIWPKNGGLLSYGVNVADNFRRAASIQNGGSSSPGSGAWRRGRWRCARSRRRCR